jgi:divinyl protochlorophyllide a 8-vinyl-reductase
MTGVTLPHAKPKPNAPADMPAPRIGPNAIIQIGEALRAHAGAAAAVRVYERAGLPDYFLRPPQRLVDEADVARLHRALREVLGGDRARELSLVAGFRTGDYLLAHRIPNAVQSLLRALPPRLASRALLAAIRRHAWTFAGSGRFMAEAGMPVKLTVIGNPLCRGTPAREPSCWYYAATFECLFRALVHPRANVVEAGCEALGGEACVFEVRWPA